MRGKIAAGEQPWVSGWQALTSSGRAQLGYTPAPLETTIRGGTGQNDGRMISEMQRAYQLALRWKVSGDTAYADLSVRILNAWSSTMKVLTGNADRFLAAGIYGYQWANVGELMRAYTGWTPEDLARFQQWLLDIFYPLSHDFLVRHNDTENANITNYWANWDLCTIANIQAIGIFCDRRDIYDEALGYYKNGRGNGAATHNVYFIHPGNLGQWQESSRDQGHATLGISLGGAICEMAWNQGEDVYGYWNNRFLAGAEYVAKSNLLDESGQLYDLPFATYINSQGTGTGVSGAARPHLRPCWELVYNHYVNRKGLAAPWVTAMAAQMRPEGRDDGGDDPSFGTLTFSRDAAAAGRAPSGLTALNQAGQVLLSWWGSAQSTAYRVKRSASLNGPFSQIGTVSELLTFTDTPGQGIWYYAVSANGASGESALSNIVRVALPGETLVRLPLDASSDIAAQDISGANRHGTLVGGATWGVGRSAGSHALALDGSSGHLVLPTGILADMSDFSVTAWVYWNAAVSNTRIFDFGWNDVSYMALIPRDGKGVMRFCTTGTTWLGEQGVAANSALPTGKWVHVALTLSGKLATLYMDGVLANSASSVDLVPFQLGATSQNWLGRSQYAADPFFNGRIQDFRLFAGALSASDVASLAVG